MKTFGMAYFTLLFLSSVFNAVAHIKVSDFEAVASFEPLKERQRVFTTTGEECKFPFRYRGRIHHHCITTTTSYSWCSLTHNFDRDRKFGFCAQGKRQLNVRTDAPCRVNPCQNGGVCTPLPRIHSFECSCPKNFTGRLCEQPKCYETIHLRYYDIGESWGRIHLRNVEQCTCVAGEIKCERVYYTKCNTNPCQNDGTCRLITSTQEEVCHCRNGYSGPHCNLEPETECYNGRGAGYRGVVGTSVSGAQCLPWNSGLLYNELHVGRVGPSTLRGLGDHTYCRNPDGDKKPWCYTINYSAISWEYCDIPPCVMALSSSRRIIPIEALLTIKKSSPPKSANKPVCGIKHKKRFPMPRILGGTTALPGTHPWMAALYIGQSDFCGGSLISSCWVISAAHCFINNPLNSQIRVVLGQHKFNETGPNTQAFGVERYIFPESFSVFNPTLHDIVLVKLKKQDGRCARKTPFIRPICLPEKNMSFPVNFCCAISGWGHKYEKAKDYSILQEGYVRLYPHSFCKRPDVYGNHVTSDMVCAGLSGCVDACQGDSGGPLACAKDGVSFLYGIISWGEGCGHTMKPGVYTKVVNYVDWINSKIRRKPKA